MKCLQIESILGEFFLIKRICLPKIYHKLLLLWEVVRQVALMSPQCQMNTFNQKRWDYFYSRVTSAGRKTEERVTIYFDSEGNLERMTGDYLPSSAIAEER